MQSVILAAGKGTRMGELTKDTPKPMLRVQGKPLLEHHLNFLPDAIDEVIFVIGYLGEQIRGYFGEKWQGRKIRYVVHEKIDGTAKALISAREVLRGNFLVTMGDDLYVKKDLERLATFDVGILVHPAEDPTRFGVIETDANGRLVDIEEKPKEPKSNLVSTNAFVLDERFFSYDPVRISEAEFGLPQTILVMSRDYPVEVVTATAWQPVGKPEDIAVAEKFLEEKGI